MSDFGFVAVTNFVPYYKIAFANHFNLEMKMKILILQLHKDTSTVQNSALGSVS